MSQRLSAAFRENLAVLLTKRGWSQNMLADRMGVTKGYVSQLLRGHAGVGLDAVENAAKALEVDPYTLIKEHRKSSRAS